VEQTLDVVRSQDIDGKILSGFGARDKFFEPKTNIGLKEYRIAS
jgi:hypothetical protein